MVLSFLIGRLFIHGCLISKCLRIPIFVPMAPFQLDSIVPGEYTTGKGNLVCTGAQHCFTILKWALEQENFLARRWRAHTALQGPLLCVGVSFLVSYALPTLVLPSHASQWASGTHASFHYFWLHRGGVGVFLMRQVRWSVHEPMAFQGLLREWGLLDRRLW